ncbi:hypothetical protein GJ496_003315 [Pomphorhynchus laevis]|nr:hypothetical protein GJ496_003315 [Pomphorhynchus laevis]
MDKLFLEEQQRFIVQQQHHRNNRRRIQPVYTVQRKRPHFDVNFDEPVTNTIESHIDDITPSSVDVPASAVAAPLSQLSKSNSIKSESGSQQKFSTLCRIVNFLQARYLNGHYDPITLNEIITQLKFEISQKVRTWLLDDALKNNPRVRMTDSTEGMPGTCGFSYEPPLKVTNRKSLLRLLKEHHHKGDGGILVDDIRKSLPNADVILKMIANCTILIQRSDKKEVLFYRDSVNWKRQPDDIRQLWRDVPMDGVDMFKIEQHLKKRGISHVPVKETTKSSNQRKSRRKHVNVKHQQKSYPNKIMNVHMQGILKDYSNLEADCKEDDKSKQPE